MDWKKRIGREAVGVVLLVVLLLAGLYSSWDMGRTHRSIARQLEDGAWFALTGDWEKARTAAAAAEMEWEGHRKLAFLVTDRSPMEQIDALFARLGICSAARNNEDFAALSAELSRKVEAMGQAHSLSLQNLL